MKTLKIYHIDCKYFVIALHSFMWVWMFQIPKYKNWSRLMIDTPLIDFWVNGWIFWGKKQ